MTFGRARESWGPRQDDDGSAVKPTACPECRSKKFGTLAAIITRDTYWRCHECGIVWNEVRYRQQHKRQW